MKIRKATVADFEALQPLYQIFSSRLESIAPDHYVKEYQDFSLFTGIVEHPAADILVAVGEDGSPLGAVTVWERERPLSPHIKPATSLCVSYMAASDEALYDELIRAAEKEALSRGIDRLEISLHEKDVAGRSLCESQGFAPEITTYVRKI